MEVQELTVREMEPATQGIKDQVMMILLQELTRILIENDTGGSRLIDILICEHIHGKKINLTIWLPFRCDFAKLFKLSTEID